MQIRSIHTLDAGPLGTRNLDLQDGWTEQPAQRVLFSGPNGSGKSWTLRAVAGLWEAFGRWLHTRKPIARGSAVGLPKGWGGFAVRLDDVPFGSSSLVLFQGSDIFAEQLRQSHSDAVLVGTEFSELIWPWNASWLDEWAEARNRMLVSAEGVGLPNIVYLDAERRWIAPRRGIGEIRPEDLSRRWLPTYRVSSNWEGQLEASLLALKAAESYRFADLVEDMNGFLVGKAISQDVKLGENRLRVLLRDSGNATHWLDELSSGEHQVLIQLYMVGRWLEPGGIVLIDEPDLHIHPSLIPAFLSRLEAMVRDRDGQLLITSHSPDIWDRYEALGHRIGLGAGR